MSDSLVHTHFAEHYYIEERVRAGGMAVVYKAHDTRTGRLIALKVLQENLTLYDDIVLRFRQEARIGQQLQHPNIVPVYEAGQFNTFLYIAMEFIPGGSLADAVTRTPQITLGRIASIIEEIASALDYAHTQRVIHRDLKLGNILMNDDNSAMLTDFGIARWLEATNLTQTGHAMPGTVKYMSPEQAQGTNENLDHRSDVYSFAVIGYLLSTGRYPFTGAGELVIINQHINMYPPLPSSVNSQLPAALDDVLRKGLEKMPDDRYQSAGEFASAFRAAVTGSEDMLITVDMRADNPAGMQAKPDTVILRPDQLSDAQNAGTNPVPGLARPVPVRTSGVAQWVWIVAALILAVGLIGGVLLLNPPPQMPVSALTATGDAALVALVNSQTPTPSPTFTETPSPTVTDTPTATSTDTPTPTDTPTATPTDTPTATDTPTHTPTFTLTYTPSITPTSTITPRVSSTPTLTPSPTLPYNTPRGARDVLLGIRSPNAFNCALFTQAYEYLESGVANRDVRFNRVATWFDDEDDPLREIYELECLPNRDDTSHSISFDLFSDMQDVLNQF